MSAAVSVLAALLLATVFGAAVWSLIVGRPNRPGCSLAVFGEGYLLGALLVGNGLWLAGAVSLDGLFVPSAIAIGVASILLGALAWRQPRAPAPAVPSPARERLLASGIACMLALLGIVILLQAWWLPTLTWDAWNAWLAKSKAWYHAGAFLPVIELGAWLQHREEPVLSTVAAAYPEALPRLVAWLAAAAGRWHDGDAHLAWPLLWGALGLMLAGALRMRGLPLWIAAVAAAFMLTLPLITAHASLAGYADLWLAAGVLAAGHHLARAVGGERRAWLPGLLFALLLPTIKLEGAVWMLILLLAAGLWMLPARLRIAAVLAAPMLFVLTLGLAGRIAVPLPGLGAVAFSWGEITVPVVGTLELFWRPVAATVAQSLLLLPNWSLLFYLLVPLLAWRWRRIAALPEAMLGTALLLGAGFLFVLFFFTDASRWAEDLTSLNRLVMHAVPLLVFWLTMLLRPPPAVRGRWA